jgi:hypothetical protein
MKNVDEVSENRALRVVSGSQRVGVTTVCKNCLIFTVCTYIKYYMSDQTEKIRQAMYVAWTF